jgi:hypothetical protein
MKQTKTQQRVAILTAARDGDVRGVKRLVEGEGAAFVVRCVRVFGWWRWERGEGDWLGFGFWFYGVVGGDGKKAEMLPTSLSPLSLSPPPKPQQRRRRRLPPPPQNKTLTPQHTTTPQQPQPKNPPPNTPTQNSDDGGGCLLHACVSSLYPTHDNDGRLSSSSTTTTDGKRKKKKNTSFQQPGREPKSRKALAREAEERERREREKEGARLRAAGRVEVAAFVLRVDEQRWVGFVGVLWGGGLGVVGRVDGVTGGWVFGVCLVGDPTQTAGYPLKLPFISTRTDTLTTAFFKKKKKIHIDPSTHTYTHTHTHIMQTLLFQLPFFWHSLFFSTGFFWGGG